MAARELSSVVPVRLYSCCVVEFYCGAKLSPSVTVHGLVDTSAFCILKFCVDAPIYYLPAALFPLPWFVSKLVVVGARFSLIFSPF